MAVSMAKFGESLVFGLVNIFYIYILFFIISLIIITFRYINIHNHTNHTKKQEKTLKSILIDKMIIKDILIINLSNYQHL